MPRAAAAAGLILIYFAWFAGPWLTAGFTPDDLMNCHRALEQPLGKLLLDHLTIYQPTPEYRPLGSLFYRVLYQSFGFQPLPFHLALYVVLVANLGVTYVAVEKITGVRAAAWIATVFHAWHNNWTGLHLSFGFCFDVLCYFFYAAALVAFGTGRLWLFVALFLLCLNSKEMAVSLPVVCLAWKGWECRRSANAAIAAGVLTAVFIGGRLMVPEGLSQMEPYAPHFTMATLVARVTGFLEAAAYGRGRLLWAVAILGVATGWSLLFHTRAAVVSIAILGAGVLPVAFIPQRSLEAVYVPALGAAILLALPLADLCRRREFPAIAAAVLLAGSFHHLRQDRNREAHLAEAHHIESVSRQLRQAAPCLPPGARVLFLRDPFPRFDWDSLFLVHLLYGDRSIIVHRPGRPADPPASYDAVFDWDAEGEGGGPGHGVLRRISLATTSAMTAPKITPSK